MLNPNFRGNQRISYTLLNQSRVITSALQEVNPNIQKLNKATRCAGAKNAIAAMREKLGVDSIYKEGGISILCGDSIVKLFSPDRLTLKIRELSANNREDFKYVELKDSDIVETRGFDSRSVSVEDFLTSVFEKLDFPILQLRRFFRLPEINEVLQKITPKAVLSQENAKTADDIKSLFYEIQERLASIQNGVTRSKIKNSYPHARPSNNGSYQLKFADVGSQNLNYSVNIITIAANQQHLVIGISENSDDKPQMIIVDPKNRVLKEKNLGKIYKLGSTAVYYIQQELNSPLFAPKLELLRRELEQYNEYLKVKITELNAYKAHLSTGDIGIIDRKTLTIIKSVKSMFDNCKAKMLKIKDAPRKKAFKQKYDVDTRDGSPSLIFKNVNDNGETLHLSFPVMAGEQCMKIIVEKRNGNIGKSFFVNGDKLVKFNATSLGRSKRTELKTNYHSQEEIDSSGLKEYLTILKKRLSVIPMIELTKK